MLRPFMRDRLKVGLAGLPDVLDAMLRKVSLDDPIWDLRPDPDRFTLREVVAHLADYEEVWPHRISRILNEDNPSLEKADHERFVIDNDYAHSDPFESLSLIRERRPLWVALLHGISEQEWQRAGVMPGPTGVITLEVQETFVGIHDSYHTAQVAQWLDLSP